MASESSLCSLAVKGQARWRGFLVSPLTAAISAVHSLTVLGVNVMKIIDDLIESEHSHLDADQFAGVQFTGFATSWQAVARYHTFLTIIVEREAKATEVFSLSSKAFRDTPPSPGPYLTAEQERRLDELDEATDLLHLEIESFYLFAKILLDVVARAIEKYFGLGRACSLDSHHDLIDNFAEYAAQKKLDPTDFIEKAKQLRADISNFRDHEIAHSKRLNRVTGTALTADRRRATMIAASTVVPPERFKPEASSIHVGELMSAVENYIASAIEIVKTNRDKTNLTFTS